MESDFKILRSNDFQPRILNPAKRSSRRITTFSDVLDLHNSDPAVNQARLQQVRGARKTNLTAGLKALRGDLQDGGENRRNQVDYYQS